jgi:molecular chaperone DnaJ
VTQTKKAKYDQYGHQAFDGSGGFGGGGGGGHGMNMDDIFSQFGIFSAVPWWWWRI